MPYVRLMICLGWCYCSFPVEDLVSYGQMLLPMFYHLADVTVLFNVVVVGKTLHHMCGFDNGRCYCQVARWNSHFSFCLRMADVIAMWQDGTATFLLKMADVIARW